jgi:hypothetical protein
MRDWKGMLKKGVDLAKQAKSELEERGLVGDQSGTQSSGAGPDEAELPPASQVYEVTGPTHPHPFDLLTNAEVAAALGAAPHQVAGPTANVVDDCAGPSWRVEVGGRQVAVELLLYLHPVDVEELLGYTEADVRPLPGVGDRAAIAAEGVAVTRGGEVVTIHIYGGDGINRRSALEVLAQAVAGRLPDFRQYAARMSAPDGPILTDVLPTEEVARIVGGPLGLPQLARDADEVRAVWRGPRPLGGEGEEVRVEVTHYLVDPWEKQRQLADAGSPFAKAAVQMGETLKSQLAQQFGTDKGPWDEGFLMPTEAYFKKGGHSFKIEVHGLGDDASPQVLALAERLAELV